MIRWSFEIELIVHIIKSSINFLDYTDVNIRIYLVQLILNLISFTVAIAILIIHVINTIHLIVTHINVAVTIINKILGKCLISL